MADDQDLGRRRFHRVGTTSDLGEVNALLGVKVLLSSGESLEVFDMSSTGLAMAEPTTGGPDPGDQVDFELSLPLSGKHKVSATVRWKRDTKMGVEFPTLAGSVRLAIEEFLSDRLIGTRLRAVDRQYYGPGLTCDHWYHGPKGTNVFLWMKSGQDQVERAVIELDGRTLSYEKGVWQIADQAQQDDGQDLGIKTPFGQRVLALLTQMPEQQGPLRSFLSELAKRPK